MNRALHFRILSNGICSAAQHWDGEQDTGMSDNSNSNLDIAKQTTLPRM